MVAPNRNHEIRFIIGTKGNYNVGCLKDPGGNEHGNPHLICKGAAEAIEFYEKAFGAVDLRRVSDGKDGKLIYALISIGDSKVMLVDEFPG